ncbi:hypothetical protein C1Y63_11420 [Corynebacterium sp. 13CS0277]|uniref:hypothetical protein n=1 Tax=Corynebacterium sp. 13CS0277 TaxID=2071994 RepID=UPI000D026997|nr:hypothetical protein [Corynebacterium sp. 13CS0277]PRQ10444.1 hypothetical protein C1Y63_11420 [Corynebacterium sp. 13CS0277]
MADDIDLVRKVLDDASNVIDHDLYPATTAFVRVLTMLTEDRFVVDGQIDTNHLASFLVSNIAFQEERVNKLEEIVFKHIDGE